MIKAKATNTKAELSMLEAQFDAWHESLHRDKRRAMPSPDLDVPEQWVPAVWQSGMAVATALVNQFVALSGGAAADDPLSLDPSLDNDVLLAQMQRSMAVGF